MTEIMLIAITAVVTSTCGYLFSSAKNWRTKKLEIHKERLTKLLLPLYMQLQAEHIDFLTEQTNEDGDPAGFLDDLPKYYSSLEEVIKKYLYLADDELTEKALKFVGWFKVSSYDNKRFGQIMTTGIYDESLEEFRKCVYKKYNQEKKRYLDSSWAQSLIFWSS